MSNPNEPRRKPLVTVEYQTEIDVATGEREKRMFVKMYFDARDSGLLADIPPKLWVMLCCLSTYMNENGYCHPSQAELARKLAKSRETVNRTIQELIAYRFQGRPVISVERVRLDTDNGQRWANNVYLLHPISGLGIFDSAVTTEETEASACVTKTSHRPYVTESSHRPVLQNPDTGNRHTNQSHRENEKNTRQGRGVSADRDQGNQSLAESVVQEFHRVAGQANPQRPLKKELIQATGLLAKYDSETVSYIVKFAVEKGAETNFRMQHFGAVIGYVDQALAEQATIAARAERERLAKEQRDKEEEERRAEQVAFEALPAEARAKAHLERWTMFQEAIRKRITDAERGAKWDALLQQEREKDAGAIRRSA